MWFLRAHQCSDQQWDRWVSRSAFSSPENSVTAVAEPRPGSRASSSGYSAGPVSWAKPLTRSPRTGEKPREEGTEPREGDQVGASSGRGQQSTLQGAGGVTGARPADVPGGPDAQVSTQTAVQSGVQPEEFLQRVRSLCGQQSLRLSFRASSQRPERTARGERPPPCRQGRPGLLTCSCPQAVAKVPQDPHLLVGDPRCDGKAGAGWGPGPRDALEVTAKVLDTPRGERMCWNSHDSS